MKLYKLFKSILEQDTAPVVVCDTDDIIVWINVNKVDSKKRKNYTDISNASFWLGVRPLLCE